MNGSNSKLASCHCIVIKCKQLQNCLHRTSTRPTSAAVSESSGFVADRHGKVMPLVNAHEWCQDPSWISQAVDAACRHSKRHAGHQRRAHGMEHLLHPARSGDASCQCQLITVCEPPSAWLGSCTPARRLAGSAVPHAPRKSLRCQRVPLHGQAAGAHALCSGGRRQDAELHLLVADVLLPQPAPQQLLRVLVEHHDLQGTPCAWLPARAHICL